MEPFKPLEGIVLVSHGDCSLHERPSSLGRGGRMLGLPTSVASFPLPATPSNPWGFLETPAGSSLLQKNRKRSAVTSAVSSPQVFCCQPRARVSPQEGCKKTLLFPVCTPSVQGCAGQNVFPAVSCWTSKCRSAVLNCETTGSAPAQGQDPAW